MVQVAIKAYSGLVKQLHMVAINSKRLEQRDRMRDNMLRIVARSFDASSAYICQHDFETKLSTVRHHFIGTRAIHREQESDLGHKYHENMMGDFANWLNGNHSAPYLLHVHELPEDAIEREEYDPYGIKTVIMSALYFENRLWGYLEIWDSRRVRNLTENETQLIEELSASISDTILTKDG